ncbi:class II fructose-bisphosphate aldolase [Aspergillus undulatus]|uniref:class II fructose-bisphosphate aldolase n=1 Tax=Aspergillus undulatus TaxID=1810928 RepID=UPI003CCD38BE
MTDWKENNTHIRILRDAEAGGYGVLAVIAYNIEQVHAFVQAAATARSPLILQFFPWAIKTFDGSLIQAAADAVKRTDVPISIHLDHAQSEDLIRRAAELPFDSIMVDMSHYEKEENLSKTAQLVRHCNERQIATEAEPGRIEGGEDGVMDTAGLQARMTTAEEVDEFIATGVDTLAPSFGNVHGEYGPRGPQLDFDRFESIRGQVNKRVRMAVHGTNGFPPGLIQKCIAAGCSKINVNRLVLDDYYEHLAASAGKMPHTQLIEEGIEKVTRQTIEWMEICGSAGRV